MLLHSSEYILEFLPSLQASNKNIYNHDNEYLAFLHLWALFMILSENRKLYKLD